MSSSNRWGFIICRSRLFSSTYKTFWKLFILLLCNSNILLLGANHVIKQNLQCYLKYLFSKSGETCSEPNNNYVSTSQKNNFTVPDFFPMTLTLWNCCEWMFMSHILRPSSKINYSKKSSCVPECQTFVWRQFPLLFAVFAKILLSFFCALFYFLLLTLNKEKVFNSIVYNVFIDVRAQLLYLRIKQNNCSFVGKNISRVIISLKILSLRE